MSNGAAERPQVAFLLDHRTHVRWLHEDNAEISVVPKDAQVRPPHAGVQLLSLLFPIHADELRAPLEQLGQAIQ